MEILKNLKKAGKLYIEPLYTHYPTSVINILPVCFISPSFFSWNILRQP